MKWIPATTPPPADGSYLVHAPSGDDKKPLITTAWYDPEFGWSLLPPVWINAISHWMKLPPPPEG